jgi:hypothetical protein
MKPGKRFTSEAVFICYLQATRDFTPTLEELSAFEDKELFKVYAKHLDQIMPQHGLDPKDIDEKSTVVILAKVSGLDKPKLQVKNACAYLREALDAMEPK